MVAPADNKIVPNTSSAGFSIPLVTSYQGLDHTIHRSIDGFLHLQRKLRTESSSGASSAVANVTALSPEMVAPFRIAHSLSIRLGKVPYHYILKVDTSTTLSWLQCEPCAPHAPQYNKIFDPSKSDSFKNITGTDPDCEPPYTPVFSGRLCNFQIHGPGDMHVEGFLAEETISINDHLIRRHFLIGCSHSTENFPSEGRYAGVVAMSTAPTSFVMQIAAHGVARFSYCLSGGSKANRQGFFRFGTDIPPNPHNKTTRILPALGSHEFHISVVGISLGEHKLDKIRPEMFARSKDGQGGCVIDLGTSLTMMAQEAYYIVEEAVWSDLQSHGAERVKRPGFNLCFRATKAIMGHLQPLSLHFPEEKAVMVLSPEQLFLMMDDKQGQTACLAMTPGHRTVIGTLQQVDTRFVYDLKDFTLSFVSESCTEDTVQME
ncbi:hypothetical protein EJB05_10750, partial [Eragrostis curvula]